MLRIWKATERQRLVPVEMETAFPFLLEPDHVVSLLGGGGKTTLLYEMAGFGVRNGQKVLVTTSTHLYRPPEEWRDRTLKEVERKFQAGCAAIIGSDCRDPKKIAMPEEQLFETARKKADLTLIEADGTKHLPCKVPAEHEPALLSCSDLVVGVMGLSALGQPLEKSCFRAKLAAERLGCPMDHRITEEDLAELIAAEWGQQKDLDGRAFYAVLHQYEEKEHKKAVRKIAELLQRRGIRHIFVTCVPKNQMTGEGSMACSWHGRADTLQRERSGAYRKKTEEKNGRIYSF